MAYTFARNSRQVALANLQIAFGDEMTQKKRAEVARESFVTAIRVTLDLFWFSRWTRQRLKRWTYADEKMVNILERDQHVLVSGHFGNWEIMCLMLPQYDGKGACIVKKIKNPVIDRFINRIRGKTGLLLIPEHGALRSLLRETRNGSSVAMLIDQDTSPDNGGIFLDLFGLPAAVSGAAALMSERAKIAVYPFFCRLQPDGCYFSYGLSEINPRDGESREEFTVRIMKMIESEIRKHPECWMWMYKRWKRIPENRSSDGYPFYAGK